LRFPAIQIQQQYAKLGIDAELGRYDMRQPKASIEMRTTAPKLELESSPGNLSIDQSRAWDALARGGALQTMSRIYSDAQNAALQGIARIVDNGNRLAAIHRGGNPIAEMAREAAFQSHSFSITGPASSGNVDIEYEPSPVRTEYISGTVDITVIPQRPEVEYIRGKVDIHMQQYGQVTITPPLIDLYV
jgi:hypothetical protein